MDSQALRYKASRLLRRWHAGLSAGVTIGLSGGVAAACRRGRGSAARPNVILVTMDSLRADRLANRSLTPNLNAFAAQSVRFTKAIAPAPWTKPSLSSLLTGLYPSAHGASARGAFGAQVVDNADRAPANAMRGGVVTLGEILAQHGYSAVAFTGGGFAHAVYQGRGFQHFYGNGRGLRDLFNQCAGWLAGRPSLPFFAWLHAYDTHRPYRGRLPLARFVRPRPFNLTSADVQDINSGRLILTPVQQERLTRLYDEGVRYADWLMGRLLRALRSSGLLDQSILIFTSDHGEALYEHQLVEHWDVIYNEVLHIPLLIHAPHLQPATVSQYVRMMDVMPTVLGLVGIPLPEVQGVSLLPAIRDGKDLNLSALSELDLERRAKAWQTTIAGRDWKIINWTDTEQISLFDLTADPGEKHDLWDQDRPLGRQLLAGLMTQSQENDRLAAKYEQDGTIGEGEDAQEIELRLRELGYIE